jgi:hypothetical protein
MLCSNVNETILRIMTPMEVFILVSGNFCVIICDKVYLFVTERGLEFIVTWHSIRLTLAFKAVTALF